MSQNLMSVTLQVLSYCSICHACYGLTCVTSNGQLDDCRSVLTLWLRACMRNCKLAAVATDMSTSIHMYIAVYTVYCCYVM